MLSDYIYLKEQSTAFTTHTNLNASVVCTHHFSIKKTHYILYQIFIYFIIFIHFPFLQIQCDSLYFCLRLSETRFTMPLPLLSNFFHVFVFIISLYSLQFSLGKWTRFKQWWKEISRSEKMKHLLQKFNEDDAGDAFIQCRRRRQPPSPKNLQFETFFFRYVFIINFINYIIECIVFTCLSEKLNWNYSFTGYKWQKICG